MELVSNFIVSPLKNKIDLVKILISKLAMAVFTSMCTHVKVDVRQMVVFDKYSKFHVSI